MDDFKIDWLPRWNSGLNRSEYIKNTLALYALGIIIGVFLNVMLINSYDFLSLIFLITLVAYVMYAVVVSLIWTNNRLRDSGLASECLRVALIVLSILSVIMGCILFVYCVFKPTEDPAIMIDENDYDSE
jgi:uncharacterized membrane protein YhaH (DUF805 family)